MSVVVTEPVTSGLVLLHTTLGDVSIELWPREAPKACRNFVQLCLEGYYDGVIFHRIVPGFIAQTGDASGTGSGGECIYDEGTFEDEFNQRLKFSRRGLVAMANQGTKNSNLSQFFFTLDRTDELQNRNTIFGRVAADSNTLFNVLKMNEIEVEPGTDKPVYAPSIKSVEVIDNPFNDIVPRITPKERKEQERAKREMKLERAKQREQAKRKGTKNSALLSFGAEPEEPVDPALQGSRFKSSHDALDDPRLRKEVIDDRGTSATLPPGMEGPKRKASEDKVGDEKRGRMDTAKVDASTSKLVTVRESSKSKAASNPNDKLREDIAKVQADLKKMSRTAAEEEDEKSKSTKKPKRTGPSLLQLEREKYMRGKAGSLDKGKKVRKEDDVMEALEGFKTKLHQAKVSAPGEEPEEEQDDSRADLEDVDDDDAGWLSHKLVFRTDATLDRHSIDEYSVHDPLAKNTLSLEEMKQKADNSGGRKYGGPQEESRGGRGRDGGRGGGSSRGGGGRGGEGRRDDRGSRREDEFGGGVQGRSTATSSWKSDRVAGESLA